MCICANCKSKIGNKFIKMLRFTLIFKRLQLSYCIVGFENMLDLRRINLLICFNIFQTGYFPVSYVEVLLDLP